MANPWERKNGDAHKGIQNVTIRIVINILYRYSYLMLSVNLINLNQNGC